MKKIRIGSRDSKLALVQTEMVIAAIKAYDPTIETEIVAMKTTGDKILNVTLDKVGGKGLFVKELDDALRGDHVDITVHSFKDMPMQVPDDLPIVAMSKREDPRDVLLGDAPEEGCVLGCSSKRRTTQLTTMGFTDIRPVRGNLQTRYQKMEDGPYTGIVLAAAGVKRMGWESRITRYFSTEEMIPAACQGIIAVQAKAGTDTSYLALFDDQSTHPIAAAERGFVTELDGGCSAPIAAYAVVDGDTLTLDGLYVSDAGVSYQDRITGAVSEAKTLGVTLAKQIMERVK